MPSDHPDRDSTEAGAALHRIGAMIDGYRDCALVYAAVRLKLPEVMGLQAWTAAELARHVGGLPEALYRLLRGLTAIGLCEEDSEGRFTLSADGHVLRADSDSGLRDQSILAVEQYWPAWTELASCIERGGTAFSHAFGSEVWAYRRDHEEQNATFNDWLGKETRRAAADLVASIDIGEARHVADIGGGNGSLLFSLLGKYPQLTGTLFDQPQVIGALRAEPHNPAVDCVGGDFLVSVPVDADLYLLKSVIHDWEDEDARGILLNCRAVMGAGARLMLIERVLPVQANERPGVVLQDLHMMAVTGGRERTLPQLEALLKSGRMTVSRVVVSAAGYTIIEGRPE